MAKIIIAEDEEILRTSLVNKIETIWPEAEIVAIESSGKAALKSINSLAPDVAFLDIQMGELSGIDVAYQMTTPCHCVFITAYDSYAIQAFDSGAVDYLLKPYSDKRLEDCITRIKKRLNEPPVDIYNLLSKGEQKEYLSRIRLQVGRKLWFVNIEEVICLKASGRYVEVVTVDRLSLMKLPLKSILQRLDPNIFWQVHRGTVININKLNYVKTDESEQMLAFLHNHEVPIKISRSFSHKFRI